LFISFGLSSNHLPVEILPEKTRASTKRKRSGSLGYRNRPYSSAQYSDLHAFFTSKKEPGKILHRRTCREPSLRYLRFCDDFTTLSPACDRQAAMFIAPGAGTSCLAFGFA